MESAAIRRELKRGAWKFFFVPPFSKALSDFQVSALAPSLSIFLSTAMLMHSIGATVLVFVANNSGAELIQGREQALPFGTFLGA